MENIVGDIPLDLLQYETVNGLDTHIQINISCIWFNFTKHNIAKYVLVDQLSARSHVVYTLAFIDRSPSPPTTLVSHSPLFQPTPILNRF
jgi:hypothetical protein